MENSIQPETPSEDWFRQINGLLDGVQMQEQIIQNPPDQAMQVSDQAPAQQAPQASRTTHSGKNLRMLTRPQCNKRSRSKQATLISAPLKKRSSRNLKTSTKTKMGTTSRPRSKRRINPEIRNQILNDSKELSKPPPTRVKASTPALIPLSSSSNKSSVESLHIPTFLNRTPITIPLYNTNNPLEHISNSSSCTISTFSISNPTSSFLSASSISVGSANDNQVILLDPYSYISDVFDNVIAPRVSNPSPILIAIRIILIKRLLLDKAALELTTRSITNFEELYNFIIDLFQGTHLL